MQFERDWAVGLPTGSFYLVILPFCMVQCTVGYVQSSQKQKCMEVFLNWKLNQMGKILTNRNLGLSNKTLKFYLFLSFHIILSPEALTIKTVQLDILSLLRSLRNSQEPLLEQGNLFIFQVATTSRTFQ